MEHGPVEIVSFPIENGDFLVSYVSHCHWDTRNRMAFQEAIDRSHGPDGGNAQAAERCQKGPAWDAGRDA